MHKILLATIIFCSSFLFVPALHAETSTGKVGDDNSQKIQQELEDRREEQRQEIQTKRIETRLRLAKNHAERLQKRFSFYYERLNNIITRFQARLDLSKTEGKDTTTSQQLLDQAKSNLLSAESKGKEAIQTFTSFDPEWSQDEMQNKVRLGQSQAEEARNAFKQVLELLKSALKSYD
ncbi:MAG: hypothetical protein UY18_C0001G0023 [Microgenomates group bacterium GW2011_GWF2_47_9]|nr:MAG: hypothetical protein UY18_C0001G0023 [Microgenomates group bacterium GW2011_GWF2_47_9]